MRCISVFVLFQAAAAACDEGGVGGDPSPCRPSRHRRPHILFILADDYGWGNFGVHRRGACDGVAACEQGKKEVQTPVLDSLADHGILLDRHYAFRICAPSRSSLQSGRLAVHVNILNVGVTYMNKDDPISGFAGVPRNMTGMAEKLQALGYRTHMVGKWDAGMATPEHTPLGRGYDTWTGYFQHANDYWTKGGNLEATGEVDNCLDSFTDFFETSDAYRGGVRNKAWLDSSCQNSTEPDPACYEEHIFKERAKDIILTHDASDELHPLFLFYSLHLIHGPLQVPIATVESLDRRVGELGGNNFTSNNRRLYAAMVLYLDQAVDELVAALRNKSMYDDTLIVFASDNGGPIYEPGAANNHPLRGGKYSDWEGGVRTNAFVSGGFVPEERRGTVHEGIVSIADWYGTLCEVAGGDPAFCLTDFSAEKANLWILEQNLVRPPEKQLPLLPPVDSVLQWGYIVNGSNGRSAPFHVSEHALLEWPMKLVLGVQNYTVWQGPLYPNCSTIASVQDGTGPTFNDFKVFGTALASSDPERNAQSFWQLDCADGCLFNVSADPTEHIDLASDPLYKTTLVELRLELERLNRGNFNPDRGSGMLSACELAMLNGGYYGPFVDVKDWYSKPLHPVVDPGLEKKLLLVNTGLVQSGVTVAAELLLPVISSVTASGLDVCIPCAEAAEAESWPSWVQPDTPSTLGVAVVEPSSELEAETHLRGTGRA
mmetsp:Transcript_32284/g.89174  ORF Transcript_32284/g.89174 Transcript_32284/m.89174 type:complete len:715 (+) Transcript_32284:50-2194(+)